MKPVSPRPAAGDNQAVQLEWARIRTRSASTNIYVNPGVLGGARKEIQDASVVA